MTNAPAEPVTSRSTDAVRSFYEALAAGDGAAVAEVVTAHFAEDAEVRFPGSLPHGGRVQGAARLARMFSRAAASDARVGAVGLKLATLVGDTEHVVAQVEFDWYAPGREEGIPSSALELWTFRDGRVVSLDAYYWDTAELAGAARS